MFPLDKTLHFRVESAENSEMALSSTDLKGDIDVVYEFVSHHSSTKSSVDGFSQHRAAVSAQMVTPGHG